MNTAGFSPTASLYRHTLFQQTQLIAISNKQHNQFPLTSSWKVPTGDVRCISMSTETAARSCGSKAVFDRTAGKRTCSPTRVFNKHNQNSF